MEKIIDGVTMSFEIRQATIEDLNEIAKLFNEYRVFYQQVSDYGLAKSFISERINNNESVIFIAENSDGKCLGFSQLYPTFSSVSVCRSFVLNDLFVAPDSRCIGVAKSLLNTAKKFATDSGANGLALATSKDNVNAQALYESLGYVRDTEYYSYFLNIL